MKFHVMSLFPEMMEQGLSHSIIGRSRSRGLIELNNIDIRDFTTNKHNRVDDTPYGGGCGMLIGPQPVYDAFASIKDELPEGTPVIYLTPQGRVFNQDIAKELANHEQVVLLCGHYEGIDERVLDMICTDYLSIGDYVLTGGELPAMIVIDCVSRLLPDVLHNADSFVEESFENGLLEHPQYTRPPVFMGREVPEVLLTGHHGKVEEYRLKEAERLTRERRPDLYEKYIVVKEARERAEKAEKEAKQAARKAAKIAAKISEAPAENEEDRRKDERILAAARERAEVAAEEAVKAKAEAERLMSPKPESKETQE